MNNIVRILIGLMFINIYSQKEVVGKIIDKDTKSMISYVNIGIKNKGVGTVSNESGLFNLVLTENISSNDMIVFSHLGYKTKKYSVSSLLKGENFIELIPSITNLEEVIVKFKEPKAKKIGRKRKGFVYCG